MSSKGGIQFKIMPNQRMGDMLIEDNCVALYQKLMEDKSTKHVFNLSQDFMMNSKGSI